MAVKSSDEWWCRNGNGWYRPEWPHHWRTAIPMLASAISWVMSLSASRYGTDLR
jgi:hypothetical protein